MSKSIVTYLAILVTILALDAVWLGVVARRFYAARLGDLMAPSVQWWAAVAFYLVFAAGVSYFVVLPRQSGVSFAGLFAAGAFFGFVCYATYDLTSQAVIRGWPFAVTIVDMAWGAVITGIASVVGAWVAHRGA